MVERIKRFDVCLIGLDPTIGSEMKKTRPCLVVSPDEMNNSQLKTIIIAPMISQRHKNFPSRVPIRFQKKPGEVALDQLRVIDKKRIIKKFGAITSKESAEIIMVLQAMFCY